MLHALRTPRSVVGLCLHLRRPEEAIGPILDLLIASGRVRLSADGWRYEYDPQAGRPKRWTPDLERGLIVLMQEGERMGKIARALGRHRTTVRRRIERATKITAGALAPLK